MAFVDIQSRLNAAALRRFGTTVQLNSVAVQADAFNGGKELSLDGMPAMARNPAITVADADVPTDPVGNPVVMGGKKYTVREVMPDGHGLTLLHLKVAA